MLENVENVLLNAVSSVLIIGTVSLSSFTYVRNVVSDCCFQSLDEMFKNAKKCRKIPFPLLPIQSVNVSSSYQRCA